MRQNVVTMTSANINGVRTTGIYCRSGCSGQPLARNVTIYPSPIAAEAQGFRPCLRCRPDRMAPSPPEGEALVARAMRMVGEGALDTCTEAELARRLATSERHLRRLFLSEVGATPDFIARSRRAHFARRLLDETDLPMPVLASAAGFGSVRQMNRAIRQTFRFTPTELRNKRGRADRMVADGGVRLQLPYDGALTFSRTLDYLAMRAVPGVEGVDGGVYRRTVVTCGFPGVIEIAKGGAGHLDVTAHLASLASLIDVAARARRIAGLDQPAGAARHLRRDPLLRGLVAKSPGMRVPGAWDAFEVGVRIIIGQQISVRGASTIAGRIARSFGEALDGVAAFGLTHAFPPAERVAALRLDQLRTVGLTQARAESVRAFARSCADGRLALDGSQTLDEVVGSLRELPGIGPWSAQLIAMRAGSYADAFPAEDLGLRRAAGVLLRRDGDVSAAELTERAEAWRPYRALAAMHLWASLDH